VGRHSSAEQAPFLRSLLGWFLPWLLVAAVAAVAVVVGVNALGQDELAANAPPARGDAPAAASPSPSPSPTSTPVPVEPSPTPTPEKTPKSERPEKPRSPLITDGISVQVLDAADSAGATDALVARLERLGFEIAVVGSASRLYDDTTVFWSSSGSRKAGEALAERFGWVAAPRPANLSPSVDLHLVVGLDEA
jgi:LytR cell envelope-related transcriptional attenuator